MEGGGWVKLVNLPKFLKSASSTFHHVCASSAKEEEKSS